MMSSTSKERNIKYLTNHSRLTLISWHVISRKLSIKLTAVTCKSRLWVATYECLEWSFPSHWLVPLLFAFQDRKRAFWTLFRPYFYYGCVFMSVFRSWLLWKHTFLCDRLFIDELAYRKPESGTFDVGARSHFKSKRSHKMCKRTDD